MERKAASGIMLTLLLISILTMTISVSLVSASLPVHNIDTGEDFATMQEAIDDPNTLDGHTILVDSRTYYEHLTIDKSISLIGENKFNTIIDGSGTGTIVSVTAKNVSLSNLTLRRAGFQPPIAGAILVSETTNSVIEDVVIVDNDPCGITLFNSTNNKVSRSEFFNNIWAVLLVNSDENMIVDNVISKNSYGIALGGPQGSSNNLLADNLISNNVYHGIDIFGFDNKVSSNRILNNDNGVLLDMANGNLIVGNNLSNNSHFGVYLIRGSEGNTINGNAIQFNHIGVFVRDYSRNNALHCNNFINNTRQVYLFDSSVNTWDNGYPSGGNYWSDYEERYPKAKELDGSGIWDTPYVIDENNIDRYPLMSPWTTISRSLRILEPTDGSVIMGPATITFVIENNGDEVEFLQGDSANRIDLEIEYSSTEESGWGIMFWSTSHAGSTLSSGEKYEQTLLYDPSKYEGSVPADFVGEAPFGEAVIRLVHWKSLESGSYSIGEFGKAEIHVTFLPPAIAANVDFNPETLNLWSKGRWITAYVEVPETCDGADIDISTVRLDDRIPAELHPTEIGDYDEDRIPDLMVKFNRTLVRDYILSVIGAPTRFSTVTLTITGKLNGNTKFEGSCAIKIIDMISRGSDRGAFPI